MGSEMCIRDSRGTVDEMKTRQNELVRQLVSVSNASALNTQNIRRLRGALVCLFVCLKRSPSHREGVGGVL